MSIWVYISLFGDYHNTTEDVGVKPFPDRAGAIAYFNEELIRDINDGTLTPQEAQRYLNEMVIWGIVRTDYGTHEIRQLPFN